MLAKEVEGEISGTAVRDGEFIHTSVDGVRIEATPARPTRVVHDDFAGSRFKIKQNADSTIGTSCSRRGVATIALIVQEPADLGCCNEQVCPDLPKVRAVRDSKVRHLPTR